MTRILREFHNPAEKSMSDQLLKFANYMVFYVIQGRSAEEIYLKTRASLHAKYAKKASLLQRSESLFSSNSSFNMSQSENLFDLSSSRLSGSNSSINRSSSKNNGMLALRENFINQSGEKLGRMLVGSESNLSRTKSNSSSNLMKAKRQISF